MDAERELLNAITERILGCAFRVSNGPGCGFLEKVYQNALVHELKKTGLTVEPWKELKVHYDGVVVGEFECDILVEGRVLIELKAVKALDDVHQAQCINYLKATKLKVCLLLNFGTPKMQVKRIVNSF